jgi:broad specificity phosphatase PhoE
MASFPPVFFLLRHGQSEANVAEVISSNPSISTGEHGLTDLGRQQARDAGKALALELKKEMEKGGGPIGSIESGSHETASDAAANAAHARLRLVAIASDFLRTRHTAVEAIREVRASYQCPSECDGLSTPALVIDGTIGAEVQWHRDQITEAAVDYTKQNYPCDFDADIVLDIRLRERFFGILNGNSTKTDSCDGVQGGYPAVWAGDEKLGEESAALKTPHPIENCELVEDVAERAWAVVEDVVRLTRERHVKEKDEFPTAVLLVAHGDVLQILQTRFKGVGAWRHRREVKHMEPGELRRCEYLGASE